MICRKFRIPVHRAVLCAESPAFAVLFESAGKEGTSAQVDMSREDPAAVMSLVEHIYTGQFPKEADPMVMLPLAYQFKVFKCVDACASALEELAKEKPAKVLCVLRPYASDARLAATWDRVCKVVMRDKTLAMAVLFHPSGET